MPASAKGTFAKITVQTDGSETQAQVTDPALLSFFAFTDFEDGTTQPPDVAGPAFIVTRWEVDASAANGFQPWDRLRYYHTSPDNTLGRGWIFYEGLTNGSSEYDGQWYLSTRNADALMENVIFASPPSRGPGDTNAPSLFVGLIGVAAALAIAGLAASLHRQAAGSHS